MKKVEVSVIVPVYNVEQYLEKCLKSLINQKFNNYEIIVVNDGSPDGSQKIIDKYVKKYPELVKGYIKQNGGLSSARNYGLKMASGKYVAFVDSDDYVTDNYLSSLYDDAKKNNSDIVVCDIIKKCGNNEEILSCYFNGDNDIFKNMLISLPAAWNKLYSKSLFVDNNIYYPDNIYYEDLATTGRLLVNAKKISYIDKALYYYIIRDGSIMNQKKYNKKMSDIFTSLDTLTEYYKENGYYKKYKEEIEDLHIRHLLHDYSLRVYKYHEGKDDIERVVKFMKLNYPKWWKNKYFKGESWKYKMVCYLIYHKQICLLKILLK